MDSGQGKSLIQLKVMRSCHDEYTLYLISYVKVGELRFGERFNWRDLSGDSCQKGNPMQIR